MQYPDRLLVGTCLMAICHFFAPTVQGNLDESMEAIQNRYGKPLNRLSSVGNVLCMGYLCNDFWIEVRFFEGKSCCEIYARKNKVALDEITINLLLQANSGGYAWEIATAQGNATTPTGEGEWRRSDGRILARCDSSHLYLEVSINRLKEIIEQKEKQWEEDAVKFKQARNTWVLDRLGKIPYGWPSNILRKVKQVEGGGISCAWQRVKNLYDVLFPGSPVYGAISSVKYERRSEVIESCILGLAVPDADDRRHADKIGTTWGRPIYTEIHIYEEEEIYGIIPEVVLHHEIAHGFNNTIKGHIQGYSFFEEGMAVAVTYLLYPDYVWAHWYKMQGIVNQCQDSDAFRRMIVDMFELRPDADGYPLAGLFMLTVIARLGPEQAKYYVAAKIRNDDLMRVSGALRPAGLDKEGFLKDLKNSCIAHGFSEDEFWAEMFKTAKLWAK